MSTRHTRFGLLALSLSAGIALGQSTAFTYQGQLKNTGQPLDGVFDLRFSLFTLASGGTQLGTIQCVDNVQVDGGVFTVTIDFGQQFATPAARYLQIEVRPDTGLACATTTGFEALSPRQTLTASPLANHAKSAFALDAADGSPVNAVFVDSAGNVGVGTTTPLNTLHAVGSSPALRLQDAADPGAFALLEARPGQTRVFSVASTGVSLLDIHPQSLTGTQNAHVRFFRETNTTGLKSVIFHSGNNSTATSAVIGVNGQNSMFQLDGGNFGIGHPTPVMPVHVLHQEPVMILQDLGPNSTQSGYYGFWNSSGTETGWMGFGTPGSAHFTIRNARSGGNIVLSPGAGAAVQVPELEITGADLAEKFPASEELEPGMVVAIDRDNMGKLCVSRGAYNTCVAGVVSGANNFSVGAVLGNLPGHEDAPAIALSGRVYVRCDATTGAIEPGDLLTTSGTPGHAMKAADRERSHGTVIGKAMERLPAGERGLVLVLVNLQ